MALWTMILRKMAKNKWLQLNLWLGLTVCVALFSSMPLYSKAILERTLLKELQSVQAQQQVYPGYVRIESTISAETMTEKTTAAIQKADRYVKTIPGKLGLDGLSFYQQRFTQKMKVYGADASELEIKTLNTIGGFKTLSDLEKRVHLIDGRMPVDRTDGVIEALATQKFQLATKRKVGDALIAESMEGDGARFRVIIVGTMDTDKTADPYLPYLTTDNPDGLLIPLSVFDREFTVGRKLRLSEVEWRLAVNYEQLKVGNIEQFVKADAEIRRYFRGRLGSEEINIPARDTISSYAGKEGKLNVMMISLYSPVMLMLAFYLFMTANLIIERQKTEISVLRSRGASRLQIMAAYTLESLILGLSALAAGPYLGVSFTKVLGASNGFLEFVQRSALDVTLTSGAYRTAALAVAGAIILILIPAYRATRVSIVDHKRQMARLTKLSFWHKAGIDIALVAIAIYLLRSFNNRQADLERLALDSDSLQIDPLLFLMPAIFSLGAGLLVLRVYPWFIRLVYWLGRRWWPPALYNTLVVISRSSGQYLTIKVFLIMTVATGLFSANAARTINDNMESRIQYAIGADIALTTRWQSDAPVFSASQAQTGQQQTEAAISNKRVQYTEPPFVPFQQLNGVESAARVFKKAGARYSISSNDKNGATTLIGIDTKEFGSTAWMKDGLLDYPINSYLNLIASNPKAVLISRSIAEQANLKPGDPINVYWDSLDRAQFTVYGIIDYWPTWNPLPGRSDGKSKVEQPNLIVGHLDTIQNRLAVEPYEVWLKLKPGVSSDQIYDELKDRKVTSLRDASQQLVLSKNDPFRLAINGVMTLGFVISMLISFFGFLLFWVLTLSGRTLQYGVLRAMGIPFLQIIGMLVSEQLLTSGAAVIIGVLIGGMISELFIPLFSMSFQTADQVPPFTITYQLSDYLHLYSIIGIMLTIGLLILSFRMSRIRISQALKLGEE
ncbi:putative ABC transport system permease protein [Paenibacillus cellulosilyticus]|uniref:Putative ABC transport system permease protein n=1 Tax=Paenibacillus cellulosilyticus TaxID=375489 RepID=A0A2V2Z107_9BACL|nr:FtsX-like permease family protein [Paenibacillus cellulosilyticus]PWW07221.1 putative ABC transport system permease protein [Paenibacillus cellulosilyticus]QKS44583.1 ABC transporter permease [Paenibacillus cellulosilyticus]